MAEAMELPMVALQSIKAGAMARLKGLSCHRLDGRGEWMLAIWKRFQGLNRCRVLPCTWFMLPCLKVEILVEFLSTLKCCFNLRLLYDFIPFIDMMIFPSHPASPSLSMIASLHHCGQISGPSKMTTKNTHPCPNP